MKKLLRCCLTAFLAFSLLGCQPDAQEAAPEAEPEPLPIAGDYRLIEMIDETGKDVTEDLSMLEEHGKTVSLTLNEDGSGLLNMFGEENEVTWTEAFVNLNGQDIPLTFEEGKLTISDTEGKTVLVFTKDTESEE